MNKVVAFACCLVLGCGGPLRLNGKVTLDGKPLADATVSFVPERGAGRPASTMTDAGGRFTLNPSSPGGGIIPGAYRVVVSKLISPAAPKDAVPALPSPEKNFDPKITDLTLERLKHQRAQSGVPAIYAEAATTPLQVEVQRSGNKAVELRLSSTIGPGK